MIKDSEPVTDTLMLQSIYTCNCMLPCLQMCAKHGSDFLEYKCRYCCSVAVFFCFGTTHFCNACHDDFQRVTNLSKDGFPHCPAGKLCDVIS